jgi:2'-5' RNA ligase
MRCFLAIELSDAARQHLARAQEVIRGEVPKGSYPRDENLHVTLKFLGNADDRQVGLLCESLRHVKLDGDLTLRANALACFPPRGEGRIVVASMGGSEGLVGALHQALEQRCRKLGFEAEHRRYHPHVTLARVRPGIALAARERLTERVAHLWPGPQFDVTEFVLFESQLHPQGSRYLKLARFDFGT